MVRFIMMYIKPETIYGGQFTFQYGQIYYMSENKEKIDGIYYLHSNMVRFIIGVGDMYGKGTAVFTFQYGQIYYVDWIFQKVPQASIYIPIWLDLLLFIF